ncbi:Helix-turn-helix domain-containing protein [Amycolatopsis xylanica]|uniref:Helix-turn-helix domain-containing protein n=1 Tax=Amycolatopsis xylanica TaxID=589385 RepID=A0A1H3JMR4_9PSEU|nr:DUF5937 family protein [Amycolatopsis xylanica]SDY40678.1 Helix-turn-helix domain-containing protein [Amycolatopsis xylanica]
MGLRIQFSVADLTRVTFAGGPDPMWESLLSLHVLQSPDTDRRFTGWRSRVSVGPSVRGLFRLAPPRGYSPDFLTPAQAADGLGPGLAALVGTPPDRLRRDLSLLSGAAAWPAWARSLATGDRHELRDLASALAGYHGQALRPHWSVVERSVHDDIAASTEVLLTDGTEGLLNSLHPALTWRGSVLSVEGDHVDGELRLNGRGLRLIPSYFCHRNPTVLADPDLPPVLVYPVRRRAGGAPDAPPKAEEPLSELIGATRAEALRAIVGGCTTTELARRLGLSNSTASYHASIMRAAGLITTERTGVAVLHRLTALGSDILRHRRPQPAQEPPA